MPTLSVTASTRGALIPARLRWPHSLDRLDRLLSVPAGFGKELSGGRLRIGWDDRRVDDALLELADRIAEELPEGFSLEVYAGWIVIGGARTRGHDRVVQELDEALRGPAVAREWLRFRTARMVDPQRRVHTAPDLVVVPADTPLYGSALRGSDVLLAAEVTAPDSAGDDRAHKRDCYAAAGVPLYLLVDGEHARVTLHSAPDGDTYTEIVHTPLGAYLTLPVPLEITLGTAPLRQ